jgi:hypothetical protein
MTAAPSQNPEKSKPLTVQIREAERRLQNRRQGIARDSALLAQNIRRQMSKPVTLLCAAGIGFLLGQLTKPQAHKLRDPAGKSRVVEASPLAVALNLATSIRSLYTALPVVWLMKNFNQRPASARAPGAHQSGNSQYRPNRQR